MNKSGDGMFIIKSDNYSLFLPIATNTRAKNPSAYKTETSNVCKMHVSINKSNAF